MNDYAIQFLRSATEIKKELLRLMSDYEEYQWAVAWASFSDNEVTKELLKNRLKIKRLVVGLDKLWTDPAFIDKFYLVDGVRFHESLHGIFHPKLYLFISRNKWACIIGSSNLTYPGMNVNSEAGISVRGTKEPDSDILNGLTQLIDSYWKSSKRLLKKEVVEYENKYRERKRRDGARHHPGDYRDLALIDLDWDAYIKEVKKEESIQDQHVLFIRLKVLSYCRYLLNKSLDKITDEDIARFIGSKGRETFEGELIDWGYFGSQRGYGDFKRNIGDYREELVAALNQIPTEVIVTEDHYRAFIEKYGDFNACCRKNKRRESSISSASRLLAMKRPDYFLCVNRKNRKGLRTHFGVCKPLTFSNYWKLVIEPILSSNWWRSDKPKNPIEAKIWLGRAAMLDAILYDENS